MDDADFHILLVALSPVCDFCSSEDVAVAYLIEDFSLPEFHWGSKGSFAACTVCRDLIEGSKVIQLEERAYMSFRIATATLGIPEELMRGFIRRVHREFWLRLRGGTPQ